MGCDIHMYCEVRKDGKWQATGAIFKNEYYNSDRPLSEYNQPKSPHPYDGRNYDLFAILADVRNGYGFAGTPTGGGFNPMFYPRGLPKNVSPEVESESKHWGCDGHSHSYVTLEELKRYDWNQVTTHYGTVGAEDYKEFKKNGRPSSYSAGVYGRDIVHVTNEEMDKLIASKTTKQLANYYTQVEWEESYGESCGYFYKHTLAELEKLGDPENVRIVFWFDN